MKKILKLGYLFLGITCISLSSFLMACSETKSSISSEYQDTPQLIAYKESCYEILDEYVNFSLYRDAEKEEIRNLIAEAKESISKARSIIEADDILNRYLSMIDDVLTDEDYRKTETPTYENSTSTEQSRRYASMGYESLYDDMNFREPMVVSKPLQVEQPFYYFDNLLDYYQTGKTEYAWEIAQWASRYDLIGNGEETSGYTFKSLSEDGLEYQVTSKGEIVNNQFVPAKQMTYNTKTGSLRLISNCSVEYGKEPRDSSWVHLLMQQNWDPIEKYYIADKESIIMESELTVNKCVNYHGSSYNPSAQAAQVVWYLLLRNKNPESEGYGQAIWFGLGVWDNRNVGQTTPQYASHDAGTGTIIISPASNETHAKTRGIVPDVGEKISISVDVLPLIREAFITAREKGYLSKTDFTDLYINHTNFGFEMPGTFDIDVSYDSIGVYSK